MDLPGLRADLQLSAAAPALDGSPRWTLADPVRGRYFKLGAAAMRLLRHWSLGTPGRCCAPPIVSRGCPWAARNWMSCWASCAVMT